VFCGCVIVVFNDVLIYPDLELLTILTLTSLVNQFRLC